MDFMYKLICEQRTTIVSYSIMFNLILMTHALFFIYIAGCYPDSPEVYYISTTTFMSTRCNLTGQTTVR